MPDLMTLAALVFAAFNALLLIMGSVLWGPEIWLIGTVVLCAVFPLMFLRRRQERS